MTTNNKYDDLEEIELAESNKPSFEDKNNDGNKKTNNSTFREFLSYVKIIVIAIGIAYICNQFIIVNAKVPTGSMKDTIMEGNRLIGFRLSYLFTDPKRLDVVIFKYPDDENIDYIKRVIGLPGDIVQIKSGVLYINGDVYNEDYLKEPMVGDFGPFSVPEGHYFMLGDNRNDSKDSRFWINKYVSENKILAKAIFKYYPYLGEIE